VRGTLSSRAPAEIAACIVSDLADARIVRLHEYIDSAAVDPVLDDRIELMDPALLEDFE
jgi:hypothetical protein